MDSSALQTAFLLFVASLAGALLPLYRRWSDRGLHYRRELATTLHAFYNAERVLVAEEPLRDARVYALCAVQQVLRNGLNILGASAPESM